MAAIEAGSRVLTRTSGFRHYCAARKSLGARAVGFKNPICPECLGDVEMKQGSQGSQDSGFRVVRDRHRRQDVDMPRNSAKTDGKRRQFHIIAGAVRGSNIL